LVADAGGYVVQVSSQKSEADAQASYRALQSKFPTVLGSRPPVIKRADLGDKGVYYRAIVGPFDRRGLPVLRQPEKCGRAVRRPKELTVVSWPLGCIRTLRMSADRGGRKLLADPSKGYE